MPRRRDPKDLLAKARQLEEEARTIRAEAERLRRELEAQEDRRLGATLRRLWKRGWAGATLEDVVAAADEVFGEPPASRAREDACGTPEEDGANVAGEVATGSRAEAHGVSGDLFEEQGGPSHGGE